MYRIDVKKIVNSDKFRQAAIQYTKCGYYTAAPKGTTAFYNYWDEETRRSLEGFTAEDGDYISGYFYFYLNYCQIVKIETDPIIKRVNKVKGFPKYWDYDKCFFDAVEEAEKRGKHLAVLKARRKGYSYKISSMLTRNYYLIPSAKSYAFASENEFLTKDGILTKAWEFLDFIDENTAWYKKRQKVDTRLHKRASAVIDKDGVKVEIGYKSEIIGVTLKNDVQKIRGKSGKLIIYEEAGKFPNLKAAWQIARPSIEQGKSVHGIQICFGTGGSGDAEYEGLQDIFYHPDAYNCLPIENIWDDGAQEPCGFFVPDYYNFGEEYMDSQGNSDVKGALQYGLVERGKIIKSSSDRSNIDRYIAEHCVDKDTWVSYEDGIDKIINIPGVFCTGEKDLYKVTTEDGTELLITKNHPIYNGKEYIELEKLKVGDKIQHLNINFNKEYIKVPIDSDFNFLKYDLTIDEQWGEFLGFFMGDGSFYGKTGSLSVVFDKKDFNSAIKIHKFLTDRFGYTQFTIKADSYIELRIVNKNLIKLVRSLDLIEKSSRDSHWHWKRKVHIPDYIMKSPKNVVASFLRGYFDSDGHIIANGQSVGVGSKHKEICLRTQLLLRGFNIHSKFSSRRVTNGKGYVYDENKVSIRACDVPIFAKEIGFVSERKNSILQNYIPNRKPRDYSYSTIKSIEFEKKDLVYNIETKCHYYSACGLWVHNCFTPMEATLQISTNIFPKAELIKHLGFLRTNKKASEFKQVGKLIVEDSGLTKWVQSAIPKDLTKYRVDKSIDPSGEIVIWEHPVENPPWGLYIASCDSYDYDQSNSGSLGSVFVYKRFQKFESFYDILVAEYTGRPEKAEMFYENVKKLLQYYNSKLLYENQTPGLAAYFRNNHVDYLLADQPDIINKIIKNSTVNRSKGIHMTKEIKAFAEGLTKDWLVTERSDGRLNLHTIMSEPLLEELIAYNDKGNFDRVSSFFLIMIYKEELFNIRINEKKEFNKTISFFEHGIYKYDADTLLQRII